MVLLAEPAGDVPLFFYLFKACLVPARWGPEKPGLQHLSSRFATQNKIFQAIRRMFSLLQSEPRGEPDPLLQGHRHAAYLLANTQCSLHLILGPRCFSVARSAHHSGDAASARCQA